MKLSLNVSVAVPYYVFIDNYSTDTLSDDHPNDFFRVKQNPKVSVTHLLWKADWSRTSGSARLPSVSRVGVVSGCAALLLVNKVYVTHCIQMWDTV